MGDTRDNREKVVATPVVNIGMHRACRARDKRQKVSAATLLRIARYHYRAMQFAVMPFSASGMPQGMDTIATNFTARIKTAPR